MNNILLQVADFWLGPMDRIRLKLFRFLIGFALLMYTGFRWVFADEWLTASGFHVSAGNLPYFDFTVPLLTHNQLFWFGTVYFASIAAFMIGWQLRWSGILTMLGLIYVSAADQLSFFSPNKILLISLLIVTCAEWGGYARRRGQSKRAPSAWPIRILQLTFIIHMFAAGWSKIFFGGEWLIRPFVFWTQVQGTYRTDFAAWLLNTLPVQGWVFLQWGALLFELLIPFLLFYKPLRRFGIIWGLFFQLMIAATMQHLIYFNLIMISFFVLFMDEDYLRSFLTV